MMETMWDASRHRRPSQEAQKPVTLLGSRTPNIITEVGLVHGIDSPPGKIINQRFVRLYWQCSGSISRISVIAFFTASICASEADPILSKNLSWLMALTWKQSTEDFFASPLVWVGFRDTKNGCFSH